MKRVLICSGDTAVRKVLKGILEALKCHVVQAASADTALHVLEDNMDFDLLITSMQLPASDGKELIKSVRKNGMLAALPVIVTSGPVKLQVVEELLELGAAYFIPQPVKVEQTAQYISRILFSASRATAAS